MITEFPARQWKVGMLQSSNLTTFELSIFNIRNSTNILSALLSNANMWKNPCSTTDFIWYAQTAQTDFFLKVNLSHKLQLLNVQHNFCTTQKINLLQNHVNVFTSSENVSTLPCET